MMYSPTAIKTNGDDWGKNTYRRNRSLPQTDFKDASSGNSNAMTYWGPNPIWMYGILVVADTTVAALSMRSGRAICGKAALP